MPNLYRRFHSRVDAFFTQYPRELLAVGVPVAKIVRCQGGVDLQAVGAARAERRRHDAEVRQELGLPHEATIALSVGRLDASKGHAFALEALPFVLDKFPQLHWVVLGEGIEGARLRSRAIQLGLEENVHLVGFQEHPLPYYAAADVYLRTPIYEGDNLSSNYAMAMGVPVIGFQTGTESELIPSVGHGLLVPTGDSAALAAGMTLLLASPDRGRAMGERGSEYASLHLDIQRTVDSLVEAYRGVASRRMAA